MLTPYNADILHPLLRGEHQQVIELRRECRYRLRVEVVSQDVTTLRPPEAILQAIDP